jgi:hypothetical protein
MTTQQCHKDNDIRILPSCFSQGFGTIFPRLGANRTLRLSIHSQVSLSSASVSLCCFRQTTCWLPLHMFHFWRRVLVSCIIPCSPSCCRMFSFQMWSLLITPVNGVRNLMYAAQYVVPVLPPGSSTRYHKMALFYWPHYEISAIFIYPLFI